MARLALFAFASVSGFVMNLDGSQRLAVRDSATGLSTLYGDHLRSASVAVTSSGAVQRMRYKPWGEARGTSAGAFATDRLWVPLGQGRSTTAILPPAARGSTSTTRATTTPC